jgi:hypothetical protein
MMQLSGLPRTFVDRIQSSPKYRTQVILLAVLGICFVVVAFVLFIRTVISFSYPKYAFEFVSADPFSLSETFPQFTICPGPANYSTQSHELIPGKIEKVVCSLVI